MNLIRKRGDDIEIDYESSNTSVKLNTGVTVKIQNGNITGFDKDDTIGISFISIYGLDKNYKKTTSDSETMYVVGFGKEGVAIFGYNGAVKGYNKDIKDIDFSKMAITDVGVVVANEDKSKMITYDFDMHVTSKNVKGRTLPDLYLEHLYSTGLSLDNLRVLVGRVDEKLTVDEILADEEQKEKAEKYIKEFLRADLISSSTHKTDSKKNVDPTNSDKIDGGVYIWRTMDDIYSWDEDLSSAQKRETKDVSTKKMRFIPYDAFHKTFEADMGSGQKELDFVSMKGWREVYTITEDGNLELFVFDTTYDSEEELLPSEMFGRFVGTKARIATIDYKEYIKQYTMPFEFLMATAYTCENPEYAYHLAFLARETMIDLVICDEYQVEYKKTSLRGNKVEVDREKQKYTTTSDGYNSSDQPNGDPIPVEPRTIVKEENVDFGKRTTLNLSGNVNAFVVRANAWEAYFKAELWRKSTDPITKQNTPITGIEENHGSRTFVDEGNEPDESDPNSYWNTHGWLQEVITEKTGITTSYDVMYEIRQPDPNSSGYKYKAFNGLLRTKKKSKEEDKCDKESDVINHIKTIEPDPYGGYNMKYMLQKIGINDPPINVMANEREVLYRQIETFGKAFNKEDIETGEKNHTTEDATGDVVIIKPNSENGLNGTNYDWLYDYLDSAFALFHEGKLQKSEQLPDGFDDFFGDWTDGSGNYDETEGDGWLEEGTGNNDEPIYISRGGTKYKLYNQKNYPNLYYGTWNNKPCTIASAGCGMTCAITIGLAYGKKPEAGLPPTYKAHWHVDLGGTDYQNWINKLSEGTAGARVAYYYNSNQMFNALYNKEAYTIMFYAHGGRYVDHWLAILDYKVQGGTNYLFVYDPAGRVTGWKAVNDPYFSSFGYISYCIITTNPPPTTATNQDPGNLEI